MIKSKLPQIGTTIFSVMSALANDNKALNLSQGFPNFEIDNDLAKLVTKYMNLGFNQYAPMQGVQVLREALSTKIENLYNIKYNADTEITITSGATEAIFSVISAVVSLGDEVIVFEPAYDCYLPAIQLCGGIPIFVELQYPDFQIDWELVKSKISNKTKLIIINTPNNPTGKVLKVEDLIELEALVKNTDILLLGDEVYEHILFDNCTHQSLMLNETLRQRSFICNSFGKTFHVTGWKVGYCLAPPALSLEFRKVHQYVTFSTFTPVQYALAEYISIAENYNSIPAFYQYKRDLFLDSLTNSIFEIQPSEGSFFQNLSYSKVSEANDYELAVHLTKKFKIASIPISSFYNEKKDFKLLRFCFAKDDATLKNAGKILSALKPNDLKIN